MLLMFPDKETIFAGLESWDWYDFSEMTPIAVTAFGDVFFESSAGIYFLDKVSGDFTVVCKTKSELEAILNTPDGRDHYLMAELVLLAIGRGLVLDEGECYEFKVAPFLNGPIEYDNLQKMDFKISLHITGQLIKQVTNLPPGAKISEIKISDA
ncbi:MAG: DUF1851 domain-containing protein [Gammaproteobacteria bacterium]|nr:DUF1851 domain-containing protein [Gammaproteobacteria bacterium]MDH5653448.1 DUF1851 domain-containing protein [Gammaproteobacteria bacterium]